MNCVKCGRSLKDGEIYCKHCGRLVLAEDICARSEADDDQEDTPKKKLPSDWFMLASGLICILLVILGILLYFL